MTASITIRIREHLHRRGPATAGAVAEAIPELAECGGEKRALLLMRLDPNLEPASGSRWATQGSGLSDTQLVKETAQKYFKSIARPGAPLSSAVKYVCEETGLAPPEVREQLAEYYTVHGPNIFNRPKRQEDK